MQSSESATALLSPELALVYLMLFAAVMIGITFIFGRRVGQKSIDGFLVANRQIPWWLGGATIAASWTWAIALMISVQMAYEQGLAGIFWFTVPNIFAVLIYIWLGPQIRKRLPEGYSLPEWMYARFSNKSVTFLYLGVCFYYQIMAVAVQVYAGGNLLAAATGLPTLALIPTLLVIGLAYTLISGFEASVVTDFLQLALMLIIGWVTISLCLSVGNLEMNFTGIKANGGLNPFNPEIAFTAGIITSIGLISGSICDQQFWQRCFALKEKDIKKSFLFGGLLFASIPIGLALLGFTAASPDIGLQIPEGFDSSLIGFLTVKQLVPASVATMFLFVLLAGISSTLDSGLTAASSLYAIVENKPWKAKENHQLSYSMKHARYTMIAVGILGMLIGFAVELIPGFGLKYLWWLFNAIAASVVVPTVLSLFWDRLSATGVLLGSLVGLFVGVPLVAYASINGNDYLLAGSYVGMLVFSSIACLVTAENPATTG